MSLGKGQGRAPELAQGHPHPGALKQCSLIPTGCSLGPLLLTPSCIVSHRGLGDTGALARTGETPWTPRIAQK